MTKEGEIMQVEKKNIKKIKGCQKIFLHILHPHNNDDLGLESLPNCSGELF